MFSLWMLCVFPFLLLFFNERFLLQFQVFTKNRYLAAIKVKTMKHKCSQCVSPIYDYILLNTTLKQCQLIKRTKKVGGAKEKNKTKKRYRLTQSGRGSYTITGNVLL